MHKQEKGWSFVAGGLAFIWLTVLTVTYYIVHKPFTPDLALNLASAIFRLVVVGLLVAAAGGLGRRLAPTLPLSPLSLLGLHAALGLGLMALAVLVFGYLGGLRPWVAWLALAGLLVWLRTETRSWLAQWRELTVAWHQAGRLGKFLALSIVLVLFFTLISAMSPPLRFDALTYHLALPLQYLDTGRFFYVPQNMFWGMPQSAEMLYTWVIALADTQAAPTLGWAMGMLAIIGILGFALQKFSADTAWVAAATLVSGYTLASELSWGYVEWLVLLFGMAWLAVFDLWVSDRRQEYLLLAGALAGLAIGVKYTAGILLLCGTVVILYYNRGSVREAFLNILRYGAVAGLAAAPWLVKNLLATGSPVYPFLFPAGAMNALRLELYQGGQPFGGWQDVILLPWRATYIGVEGGPGYGASIGPLLFGLSLCAGLGWRARPAGAKEAIRLAGLVALTGVLAWMVLGRFSGYLLQSRLFFAFFPALAFLAGAGYSGLQGLTFSSVRLGRLASLLIVLVLGLNVFEIGVSSLKEGAPLAVLGLKSSTQYLSDNLGWFAPAMQAVSALPEGDRALLLWETRSLYCQPRCDPDEVLDRWKRARYSSLGVVPKDNAAVLASWRREGYTHLLLHRSGANFVRQEDLLTYTDADWQALEDLLSDQELVQDFGGAYQLYAIAP
jgi:hypothetical protein